MIQIFVNDFLSDVVFIQHRKNRLKTPSFQQVYMTVCFMSNFLEKKPAEAGSGCFGYKASPTSLWLTLPKNIRCRLRLLVLLDCPRCSYPRDGSRSESCFGVRLPHRLLIY